MKSILLVILLFAATISLAQENEVQQVMNVAIRTVVPDDFAYFILEDSSFLMRFDKYSLDKLRPSNTSFFKSNPDFNVDEFIDKAKSLQKIDWRNYRVERAKFYSADSIQRFYRSEIVDIVLAYHTSRQMVNDWRKSRNSNDAVIRARKRWSEKKINRKLEQVRGKYSKTIQKEDKMYFIFSTPVFSGNGNYAVIKYDQWGVGGGTGCAFVFKKENKIWKNIYLFEISTYQI